MPRNLAYAVFDAGTGLLASIVSIPAGSPKPEAIEGSLIVIVADGKLPRREVKVDRRKIKAAVTEVETISDVLLSWSPPPMHPAARLSMSKAAAINAIDVDYAERLKTVAGPFAAIHAEKRRQADAGGGPLIVDEDDRAAILANAAKQDEKIASIESERRDLKTRIRAASTTEEIDAIMRRPDAGLAK